MIASRSSPVLVIFPVLCEAHTLVLRRLGGKYATGWLSEMLSGSLPLNPEAKDYLEAAGDLRKYSDQPITLVDALLAGLGHKLNVQVWTFDRHLVTMRADIWRPTARE
jgi:predicted nucleic acid-binding protein